MLPSRVKDHLQNPNTRHEKSSFTLLVRAVQETPKTLQTMAIVLGCPQK